MTQHSKYETETADPWTSLEAEQLELQAVVTAKVGGQPIAPAADAGWPGEPAWVQEALAASWPRVLAMVDAEFAGP